MIMQRKMRDIQCIRILGANDTAGHRLQAKDDSDGEQYREGGTAPQSKAGY